MSSPDAPATNLEDTRYGRRVLMRSYLQAGRLHALGLLVTTLLQFIALVGLRPTLVPPFWGILWIILLVLTSVCPVTFLYRWRDYSRKYGEQHVKILNSSQRRSFLDITDQHAAWWLNKTAIHLIGLIYGQIVLLLIVACLGPSLLRRYFPAWIESVTVYPLSRPGQWPAGEYRRIDLRGKDLSHARLRGVHFPEADLTGANLDQADLRAANLHMATLLEAKLTGANLAEADLRGADLRGADLEGAFLTGSRLDGARLDGANLRRADFAGADLTGVLGLTPEQIEQRSSSHRPFDGVPSPPEPRD